MTRYAIGDIHGGRRTFQALLDCIQLRHTDRLYLLGDYIDRGNDSKGVLNIILQLMDYQDELLHTGNLVALNLDNMQLTFQPWLDGEAIG